MCGGELRERLTVFAKTLYRGVVDQFRKATAEAVADNEPEKSDVLAPSPSANGKPSIKVEEDNDGRSPESKLATIGDPKRELTP